VNAREAAPSSSWLPPAKNSLLSLPPCGPRPPLLASSFFFVASDGTAVHASSNARCLWKKIMGFSST